MNNLEIKPTKTTPGVLFDKDNHILEIKGVSYPGNYEEFYTPLLSWIDEYLKKINDEKVTLNMDIVYFNSASSMILSKLLKKMDKAADEGKNISINWIYEEDNEDMLECGEEFQDEIETVKFNFITKPAD